MHLFIDVQYCLPFVVLLAVLKEVKYANEIPMHVPFLFEKQWTISHSGMKNMPLDATLTYNPVYKNEFGSTVCGVDFPEECGACY